MERKNIRSWVENPKVCIPYTEAEASIVKAGSSNPLSLMLTEQQIR